MKIRHYSKWWDEGRKCYEFRLTGTVDDESHLPPVARTELFDHQPAQFFELFLHAMTPGELRAAVVDLVTNYMTEAERVEILTAAASRLMA